MTHLKVSSVTGVDLELPIAGPGGRAYAFVIDWHIRVLLALAWWLIVTFAVAGAAEFGAGLVGGSRQALYFAALPAGLIYLFYHPVLEWWMDGQTPGKRMAGIRIVTRAGEPPSTGAILIRNAFRVIDSLPVFYCIGFMTTLLTSDYVRIGDLAAGTVLVYRGEASKHQRQRLAQLAAQSTLSPEFVELVQDLLERWPQLQPDVRDRFGRSLLARTGLPADQVADTTDPRLALARLLERQ